ncbi:hypothetical protein V6N11_019397 [Hibiscus sabdariffa]|uniref:Transmembrane protein n=1 Tax=Hibiscus sabdariffa TaxID=183260 RepID=A0ABR2R2F5_9ROSI
MITSLEGNKDKQDLLQETQNCKIDTEQIGSYGREEIISMDTQICNSMEKVKVKGKRKRDEKEDDEDDEPLSSSAIKMSYVLHATTIEREAWWMAFLFLFLPGITVLLQLFVSKGYLKFWVVGAVVWRYLFCSKDYLMPED